MYYTNITQIQFAGHLIGHFATRGRAEPDVMAVGEIFSPTDDTIMRQKCEL